MKDAEPTIERLLTGLRDAEPHPGIEHRMLKAMEAHETRAAVSFWERLRPQALPAFAIWLASALAITGGLVAIALHQHRRVPAEGGSAPTLAIRQYSPAEAIAPKAPVPHQQLGTRVRSQHARPVSPVAALQAASFTAPPLPLTEQEKMLLRLTHRHKLEDMAILDPAVQAAKSVEANKQFQQFFGMNATEMRNQIE